MSETIVLNKTNIVPYSNNSKLEYKFPSPMEFLDGDEIAMTSCNLYKSIYNISQAQRNNQFNYYWFDEFGNIDLNTPIKVILPDGYYSVNTIYEMFQKNMVENGHYLQLKTGGSFIYLMELIINTTFYSVECRMNTCAKFYDFNTGTPERVFDELDSNGDVLLGVCKNNSWRLPDVFSSPVFEITQDQSLFGDLIGFEPQTIQAPPGTQNTFAVLSSRTPQMESTSSLIIKSNMVKNELSNPNNVLHSFPMPGAAFGQQFNAVSELVYSKVEPGHYTHMTIEIVNQLYESVDIRDDNMLLTFSIKRKAVS